jgi:hypothetical protein
MFKFKIASFTDIFVYWHAKAYFGLQTMVIYP